MKILWLLLSFVIIETRGFCQVTDNSNQEELNDSYFYLYNSTDRTIKPVSNVHIVATKERLYGKAHMDSIFMAKNIFPDAEAYNFLYLLNPGLRSLKEPGAEYYSFPAFDSGTTALLATEKSNGYSLVVTTNYTEKVNLFKTVKSIDQFNIDGSPVSRQPSAFPLVRAIKTDLDTILQLIAGRQVIFRRPNLHQLNKEAVLFYRLETRDVIGDKEIAKLQDLKDDIRLLKGTVILTRGPTDVPEPFPTEDISANVHSAAGKLVTGLRVFYVAKALLDDPSSFQQITVLSSPATARLPVANYVFWAGQPGNPKPLTDKLPVNVRKQNNGKPFPIDLAALKQVPTQK